jgi:hypothetical protein
VDIAKGKSRVKAYKLHIITKKMKRGMFIVRDNIVNTPPFLMGLSTAEENIKNAHDSYDVYVNEDFVGKKVLAAQTEEIDDVMNFLEKQGFTNLHSRLDGDHYIIEANEDNERLKETLSTYLKIR